MVSDIVTFDVIDQFCISAKNLIGSYSYDALLSITCKMPVSYCSNTFNEVDIHMVECLKDSITEFFIARNYDNKYVKSELHSVVSTIIVPRKMSLHVLRKRMMNVESTKNSLGVLSVLPRDLLIEIGNMIIV
jgi:hypothetical protein